MKTTYKAWLSPGNKIDWRGPAPKPFTKRRAVTVSISEMPKAPKPNATTLAAMEDARLGRNLSGPFKSVEEMIADMLKDD